MIPKKIMIVDDEQEIRDVLKRLANRLGYSASAIAKPQDAIKQLEKEVFPLIITDLCMPDMDGLELCKSIKKTNNNSVVYAFSGDIDKYGTQVLEDSGFDGYLRKPATKDKLNQAINGAFDRVYRSNIKTV